MKLTILVLSCAALLSLRSLAGNPPSDPFAGAFFPPELIVQAHERIGMNQEQMESFRARVEKVQSQLGEFQQRLQRETSALAELAKQERVDEPKLLAQLDKVLNAERDAKHLQIGLLAAIKNLLTPEQQSRLRGMANGTGPKQAEEMRQRLTAKVERVQAGARKMGENGRDPSEIARAMEEKVRPLMEAGNPFEAEAELDRILKQIDEETK